MDAQQPTSDRITEGLRWADETRDLLIAPGAIRNIAPFFRKNFGEKRPVLVADPDTLAAVGGWQAFDALKIGGEKIDTFLFPRGIHAEMKHCDALRSSGLLSAEDALPIAVGSGTINDLVKYTATLSGKPYLTVGTAASMDGYTSFGASIEANQCKQTFPCSAPRALLLDVEIVRNAPLEMAAAGYADLAAKIPAGADWILADCIGTEPIDSVAWDLVQRDLRSWLSQPEGIPQRNVAATTALIEGLILSGLAMQKAKSSRTASGAEHQFSHLLDNEHHTYRGATPSHGFKVGVGTILSLALYEEVLTWDAAVFDRALATLSDRFVTWPTIEREVRASFHEPGLVETALEQCRKKYVDESETRRRIILFRDHWPELRERIQAQLIPAAEMQRMIHAAGAPSTPEEIGLDRVRVESCLAKARLLRCRYNVLDFIADIGGRERKRPDDLRWVLS